jgi:hypothetical protein
MLPPKSTPGNLVSLVLDLLVFIGLAQISTLL